MRILGIDPGVRGGLAIVEVNNGVAPKLVERDRCPDGRHRCEGTHRCDRDARLDSDVPSRSCRDRARPSDAKARRELRFQIRRAVGTIEAAILCCEIPMTIIEPAAWKRALHLRGKDKEGARQLALQRFPAAHALLARKRDHQRAGNRADCADCKLYNSVMSCVV